MQGDLYSFNGGIFRSVELREGDRVIRKESSDYLKGKMLFNQEEPFFLLRTDIPIKLSKVLTGKEFTLALQLMTFLSIDGCILKHKDGKLLTRNCLIEITGKSERMIDRLIAGLVKQEVIIKKRIGKNSCFVFNPWVAIMGNKIKSDVYDLFKDTRWAKDCNMFKGIIPLDAPTEE